MFRAWLVALIFCAPLMAAAQTICIDPGHPSEVGSGTTGKRISELAAAWKVAIKLRDLLQADGYTVVLTKTRMSQFVRNKDRARIANESGASLLLRLHCDAASGSGFSSYYPDRQGVAKGVRGPSAEVLESSKRVATVFHAAAAAELKGSLLNRGLKTDRATAIGAKQGALTGSIHSRVPVVLVEMCVLVNDHDDRFMSSEAGQNKMAEALRAGVRAAVKLAPKKPAS